jgi:peptidoglycan/LPS O-acetylase OafA/YrhL
MVFPFLVLLSGKRLAVVVGAGILLWQVIHLTGDGMDIIGRSIWHFRSDGLLLGVLIALWSTNPTYKLFEPAFLKRLPWIGVVVFAVLVFLLAMAGSLTLHLAGSFQPGVIAFLSAALVLIASYDLGCFCPDGLIKRIFLWFGARSYTLYLTHIPAFFCAHEIWFRLQPPGTDFTDRFTVRFVYTAAILMLILTELNYRFVETPLRRFGARISKRIAARDLSSRITKAE